MQDKISNNLFQMIGIQRIFADGHPFDEEVMAFYGQFFGRIKEIEGTGKVVRYVRYEGSVLETGRLVFLGVVLPKIISIPDGMVAWVLSDTTWDILKKEKGINKIISQKEIGWQWIDTENGNVNTTVTGDFFVRDSENLNRGAFCITANAFTDLHSEIEGGDKVIIVEYDETWPKQYDEFASWVKDYLGSDIAMRIEHFGSTAISEMPAKPIIDVMVEIPSFYEARKRIIPLLNEETWEYWWYDDHMTFIKRDGFMGKRTHHVHMAPRNHKLWERIAFRDYLRTHSEDALQYANLKRNLANYYEKDREQYTNAKGKFVREITLKALNMGLFPS